MGVHDLRLRRHGGDFGADGVRAVLLFPQLDQLFGENLARLFVAALGHLLDFCFLEIEEENMGYKDLTTTGLSCCDLSLAYLTQYLT